MQIGSGWSGTTEKNKKQYISIALDEAFIALHPEFKDVQLTLWYVSKEDRSSEKSPSWSLSAQIRKKKTETTEKAADEQGVTEEIPWD